MGILLSTSMQSQIKQSHLYLENKNRMLQDDKYCSIRDKETQICQACKYDYLTLPTCQTCGVGKYFDKYNSGNPCQPCGNGEMFCQPKKFCFKGYNFLESVNKCTCDDKEKISNDWCLDNSYTFYYQSYYAKGKIIAYFSNPIMLIKLSPNMKDFDQKNCRVLNNYYTLKSLGIQCRIKDGENDVFQINLMNVKINAETRAKIQQIPTFNPAYLVIDKKGQEKFNPVVKYQETSQSSANILNYERDIQNKCYFKTNKYRFLYNQKAIIPSDHLKFQDFASIDVEFFKKSSNNNNQKIEQDILNAMAKYPAQQFEVQMPNSLFDMTLGIKCFLPFGLISISELQIIILQNFGFIYEIKQDFKNEYDINDTIEVKFINMSVNKMIANENDIFILKILLLQKNSPNNLYTICEKEIKYEKFQRDDYIEKIPLDNKYSAGDYQLQIFVKYLTEEKFSYELKPEFKIAPSLDFYAAIEDNISNLNPREPITINAKIVSQKYKEEINYVYEWRCLNCLDKFKNTLDISNFSHSNQITIPAETFDFSQEYEITLRSSYQLNNKPIVSYESRKILKTQSSNLIVNYDNYQNGIRSDELLKFNLTYDQVFLLQRNDFEHYFQIESETIPIINSKKQNVPQFYFRLDELLTKDQLNTQVDFFIRFFVKDSNNQISLASQRHYFKTKVPPQNCEIQIDQLNGNEKAFTDLINISVNNCQSQNGKLLYLFMYYIQYDLESFETESSEQYNRKYITKYIPENQISTFLPPGNILISVLVQDEVNTKTLVSKTISISKSEFDISKYQQFLKKQVDENLKTFEQDKKYEEMLCIIGLIIECIVDFEDINDTPIDEIIVIKKQDLLKRLYDLPFQIPNDQISQQLQEYAFRCLDKLLTKFTLSFQIRFDQLYQIIDKKVQQIDKLNLSDQDVKDTYQRQMNKALMMIAQYIFEINQIPPQDLKTWSQQQVQVFSNIQNILLETLNINQQKFEWFTNYISIVVDRVDSQILIKEYIKQSETNQIYYDQLLSYDVKQQYWSENVFTNDDKFKEQVTPFYKNVTDDIKQELDRVYPTIGFDISSHYDRKIRKDLKVPDNLVLPDDSQIIYQFNQLHGNGVVVCTQKISDMWSTKQCKTSVQKNGDTFNVVCTCSLPTYTTLMYDLETLFETENAKDIFSEEGIENIKSLDNWYEYAAIYTIVLINIALGIGIKFAIKKDKLGISFHGILMQQTPLKTIASLKDEIHESVKHSGINKQSNPVIQSSVVVQQKDKNKLEVVKNQELCNSDNELSKKQISNNDFCTHSNLSNKMNENLTTNQINLNIETNIDEVKKQYQFTQSDIEIRKLFVESDNKGEHKHYNEQKMTNSKNKKADKKMSVEQCNEIKKKCQQYLKQLPKFKAICTFHSLFQIYLIYNNKRSSVLRICIYYSKIFWLLAINATFGKNISISQVILLAVLSSVTFGIYKFIFQMLQKKKLTLYISYFLFVCFILFCYYATIVSISNSEPSHSNIWIISYFCSLFVNILIIEIITSYVKLIATNKLILYLQPTSIVFSILGADAIIQMFK